MVAQDFRRGARLADDFVGDDCAGGILDDVLGDEREQLRIADHSGGKGTARYFHWALPDCSSSDVSRRDHFDCVYAIGAWVVLGGAGICAGHSCDRSATFERGENSSSGAGRLFRILQEDAVAAYPARLVATNQKGKLFSSVD